MNERLPITRKPEYKWVCPNTLIFLTGAPLSGKSTIAPLVASSIDGCTIQPMDIIRLVAQEIESYKPESERNPFVNYGSCDSYTIMGDGSYSPESLIKGFNAYSEAVSSLLTRIIPKLEAQGVRDILFEGVQLTPALVAPYLNNNNKLVIVTSNETQLKANRDQMFSGEPELIGRYSTERLLLLQEEILKQSRKIPSEKLFLVDNTAEYTNAASKIINYLFSRKVIKYKH